MRDEALNEAVREAERFLKRAKEYKVALKDKGFYNVPRESGAVRRSSMDLTRALAALRKY